MFIFLCVCAKSLQLWPSFCNPMYCSPPGSCVHGILQAIILEWVATPSFRGSSWLNDQICISLSPALAGRFFTTSTTWEVLIFLCCCSIAQLCPTLCDSMDCSTLCSPVFNSLLEFAQIHVNLVDDIIQPNHALLPPSLPALNLSQNQGLFFRVSSSHQVAKVMELQLQHQSSQWIFRVYFL